MDNNKIPMEDIILAAVKLGRMMPTDRYMPIAMELATLAPYFRSEPPEGLFPMSYHTLDYKTEKEKYDRLKAIVDKYK